MLDKVGRYEFLAEPFHCDFGQRLFMGHLGNHLLNAADFHSADRGFGMKYLLSENRAWVLSRLAIQMEEMPAMYARFFVETWVESVMRYFTNRNFRVVDADGRVYGYGRSVWAMIDTATRQPCSLLDIHDGDLQNWVETEKQNPMERLTRVKMDGESRLVHTVDTCYSDVDINGHINSVKYIEHVLDSFSMDWHARHALRRVDVAYVAESHGGDKLSLYRQDPEEHTALFRIVCNGETEVCRCRLLF